MQFKRLNNHPQIKEVLPDEVIGAMVEEYEKLRDMITKLSKQKEDLGARIKDYAQLLPADGKGNKLRSLGDYNFGVIARKSVSFDETKAKNFFKSTGLYDRAYKTIEIMDEEAIDEMFNEGTVTEEDLSKLVKVNTSYSISVRTVAEAEEADAKYAQQGKLLIFKQRFAENAASKA